MNNNKQTRSMGASRLLNDLILSGLLRRSEDRISPAAWLYPCLGGESAHLSGGEQPLRGHWGDKAVLGVTGNIGVGKSTVLNMLRDLGAEVTDADSLVHALRQPGAPGYAPLVALLGQAILLPDGRINTAELASRAFTTPALLAQLEEIFHPLVQAEIQQLARNSKRGVFVVEAIKLIEGNLYRQMDAIWVIDAPRDQQIARLMRSRGLTRGQAEARIDTQNPQAEKLARANVVIHNDRTLAETLEQVLQAWSEVLVRLEKAGWLKPELVERLIEIRLQQVDSPIPVHDALSGLKKLIAALPPGRDMPVSEAPCLLSA